MLELLHFLWPTLIAGFCLALICGPLGTFVVWRRMAYLGDALAHAAFLGVALGIAWQMSLPIPIIALCLLVALALVALEHISQFAQDTLLGILAHTALSIGLMIASQFSGRGLNMNALLFGDILAVTPQDALWMAVGSVVVLVILYKLWYRLLKITISEDIAAAEGMKVVPIKLALTGLIALVIAIAMKVVGVLLITSMMIIPAAAAQPFSRSPEHMVRLSILISLFAISSGLLLSLQFNFPTGPSIVACAGLSFFVILFIKVGLGRWR